MWTVQNLFVLQSTESHSSERMLFPCYKCQQPQERKNASQQYKIVNTLQRNAPQLYENQHPSRRMLPNSTLADILQKECSPKQLRSEQTSGVNVNILHNIISEQ